MANAYITGLPAADTLTGGEVLDASQLSTTVTITASTISAQASDNSFNDSGSGFLDAGFAIGNRVRVQGFTGNVANNLFVGVITDLSAAKMTIGGTEGNVIADDAAGESVSISKWVSVRATASEIAALAGAVTTLDDLSDTNIYEPADGDTLTWDATAEAWVNGGPRPLTVTTQSGTSYTAVLADANTYIRFTSASAVTFTIPPNSSVAFPVGTRIRGIAAGAGTVTLTPDTGVTLNSRGADLASAGQFAVFELIKAATNAWDVAGDVA
jgi:hypothetical protein